MLETALRKLFHETDDPVIAETSCWNKFVLSASLAVRYGMGKDFRLRKGDHEGLPLDWLLNDECEPRLANLILGKKFRYGSDVKIDCRDPEQFPVFVIERCGIGDARKRFRAQADCAGICPYRAACFFGL